MKKPLNDRVILLMFMFLWLGALNNAYAEGNPPVGMAATETGNKFDPDAYSAFYQHHFNNSWFPDEFSSNTRLAGLSRAWAEARWNFANFDLVENLNWDSLYYAFIPKALAEQSPTEYYRLLMHFYSFLIDGHSLVFTPGILKDSIHAAIPIQCRWVEGTVVIVQNDCHNSACQVLQPGSVILEINDMDVQKYVADHVAPWFSFSTPQDSIARIYSYYLTRGPLHQTLKIKFKSPGGDAITKVFHRQGDQDIYPHAQGISYSLVDENTALLTINTFMDDSIGGFLDSIFSHQAHPKNLIIDLRRNGGGNSGNAFTLLSWLTDLAFPTSLSVNRKYRPLNRAWGDKPDEIHLTSGSWDAFAPNVYKGEVVVIIGPDTYSAAEDFLVAFTSLKRGITIGQSTGGSTGQPLIFPLPLGGFAGVCSKKELMLDSAQFVGKGIAPDITVTYTLQGAITGRDDVLEKAILFLEN